MILTELRGQWIATTLDIVAVVVVVCAVAWALPKRVRG
jgi:hypothetical protein